MLQSQVKKMLQEDAIREAKDKVQGRVFNWNITYQEFANAMAFFPFPTELFPYKEKTSWRYREGLTNRLEYRGKTTTTIKIFQVNISKNNKIRTRYISHL